MGFEAEAGGLVIGDHFFRQAGMAGRRTFGALCPLRRARRRRGTAADRAAAIKAAGIPQGLLCG